MSAPTVGAHLKPMISEHSPGNLQTIHIATKSWVWWPYFYLSEPDSKENLNLFSDVIVSWKQSAIQAHFINPRDMKHPVGQEAMWLIRMTGTQTRCQGPLIRHVNDKAMCGETCGTSRLKAASSLLHICRM